MSVPLVLIAICLIVTTCTPPVPRVSITVTVRCHDDILGGHHCALLDPDTEPLWSGPEGEDGRRWGDSFIER